MCFKKGKDFFTFIKILRLNSKTTVLSDGTVNNLVECGVDTTVVFSHSALHSKGCLKKKKERESLLNRLSHCLIHSCPLSFLRPTQPTSKLPEGHQVVVVLVQQSEGAVGHRVVVLC